MKIGIDCRMWNETGVGRYIRNVVMELVLKDKKNTYVLFMKSSDDPGYVFSDNVKRVDADIHWHTFSEQLILPIIFMRQKLDLLFVPHFNIPILYPGKMVVTIHDLTMLRVNTGRATTLPLPLYFLKRIAFRMVLYVSALRAKRVFTVSNFVKEDIAKTFGTKKYKIIMTPNAADKKFKPISQEDCSPILEKYGINKPYIFYIGNAHPHKNVEGLIEAFKKVSTVFPNLSLVLGGKKYFFYERIENEVSDTHIRDKLVFTGFIDDEDLPAIYSCAEAFVNPSLYEGFGIQILEAFACGTKVICSNTTSLPEVGGEAAYYFDPTSTESMSSVIIKSLKDLDHEREQIGYKIVQKFSWKNTANRIHEVLVDPTI